MTDVLAMTGGFAKVLLNLAFLMFIPGFAVSLVFYPYLSDITVFERVVFSGVASIATTLVALLLLDVGLGVETGPGITLLTLIIISVAALFLWRLECVLLKKFVNIPSAVPLQSQIYRRFWQIIHQISNFLKNINSQVVSRIRKQKTLLKKDRD